MKKTFWFMNDGINPDTIYGSGYPVCIDTEELERLSQEWGVDLREQMHEASEDEITEYGIYDSNT